MLDYVFGLILKLGFLIWDSIVNSVVYEFLVKELVVIVFLIIKDLDDVFFIMIVKGLCFIFE